RTARLWDIHAENEPRRFFTFNKEVWSDFPTALSPDSQALLYGFDRTLNAAAIWNTQTGARRYQKLVGVTSFTHFPAFAFSTDDHLLAGGEDNGIVWLWDAQTGQKLYELHGHTAPVRS